MWALGRTANADGLKAVDPSFTVTGPSAIPMAGGATPRPLTEAEIKKSVQAHVQTAENAINKAGFDGVEFHMAAGYLFDEFLQDVSNNRTDGYGGSIENRCRFPLEAVDAVVKAVGQERTAIRISPWSKFQGEHQIQFLLSEMLKLSRYAHGGSHSHLFLPRFLH